MKTQMPVRHNFGANLEEMAIRHAIHLLQDNCDDQLVLMYNEEVSVYLIPSILGEGQDPTWAIVNGKRRQVARSAGTIEYQVSDGLYHRSTSFDFYRLADAKACFEQVVQLGWNHFYKNPRNEHAENSN